MGYTVQSPWVVTATAPKFTRDQAIALMHQYVKNENLRRHMYACEAAMKAYAALYGGNSEEWGIVGLLHDFDWEIHPTAEEHPAKGQAILEQAGVSPAIRKAIMAHAPHTGVIAETMMEKCIFAVDELSGFIVACALVTPGKKLSDVTIESIAKKLASKSFAARVSRQDIADGIALLGRSAEDHYSTVLQSMQQIHEQLGL